MKVQVLLAICVKLFVDAYLDRYILEKGPIAGLLVKFPFLGSITQALNPTSVSLQAMWTKAPLTCVPTLHN